MDMQEMNGNNGERIRPMGCRGYIHVVEPGDTLYKLARKYDVKLLEIMRLNPYVNVYNLQVGDEICIPTMASKPEKTYIVNEGDTIAHILKAFDTDFDNLARWNPTLMEIELPEGLILKMPLRQPRGDREEDNEDE